MDIDAIRLVNFGKIKAKVDVRTSEGFVIRGFKVVEGENGLFVGMPSEKTKTGRYIDLVSVRDKNLREMLEQLVLDAYLKKSKTAG